MPESNNITKALKLFECQQADCQETAVVRYTWPGKDESVACEPHARKLLSVAAALGFHLQLIPLSKDD